MHLLQPTLILFALAAGASPSSVGSDEVDARGTKEVVFRTAVPGMHRVQVVGAAGTECSIADHLRGPFQSSGAAGRMNCDVDVMLDAGIYKARLVSPARGKGKAKLTATPFREVADPVRLDESRTIERDVHPREQVSAWIELKKRQSVHFEIAGRTAGEVALWRDGRWIESVSRDHWAAAPRTGKEIHRWSVQGTLEPGLYKLVVYGTDAKQWTKGPDGDVVFISRGAPPGGVVRSRRFSIPAWGFVEVAVEEASLATFARLDAVPTETITLRAAPVVGEPAVGPVRQRARESCSIAAGSSIPSCSVTSTGTKGNSHVISVEGPPGTTGELTWGPIGSATVEGYWPAGSTPEITVGVDGSYFVTAPVLPIAEDAPPMGCAIDEVDLQGGFRRRVAIDAPAVSWTTPFERRFNSDGTDTTLWVRVERAGLYEVTADPATRASCELFKIDVGGRERVGQGKDGACRATVALGAGSYELRLYGGRPGIQTARIAQVGLGGKGESPAKASCTFESVSLTRGRYRLTTTSSAGLRAFFARGVPSALASALAVVVDPGRPLTLPVTTGAPVVVRGGAGASLRCRLDGVDLPVRGGACRTPMVTAPATLSVSHEEPRPISVTVLRDDPAPEAGSLSAWAPEPPRMPSLREDAPLWFTFDRLQEHSLEVEVDRPGLYDVETEGLLATSCQLRTATVPSLVRESQNGRGRNCRVQAYLKPGTYRFTAAVEGESRGRAGVRLARRAPRDVGLLSLGEEVFFRVEAGDLVQQTLELKKQGRVNLATAAQGASLSCRIDDHDGWPLAAVPTSCAQELLLDAGRYTLTTLPLTVESRRRTSMTRPAEETVLDGEKTHVLALNRAYQAHLGADGKDAFLFTLDADLAVGVQLDHGMQGRIVRVQGTAREVVDVVPPSDGGGMFLGGGAESADGDPSNDEGTPADGGDGEEYGEVEEGEGDGEDWSGDGEGGDDGEFERRRDAARRADEAAAMERAIAPQAMAALEGHVVTLPAGTYVLETEHSRADVAIQYTVKIGVRVLAPRVTLQAPVPGIVDVVVPPTADARSGLLRIKTRGDVDVRCRLRDEHGVLVSDNGESGADWNCALAVPLAPGRYPLQLEAEALQPGRTELSAAFLESKDTGEMKDGDTFRVVARVAAALAPRAAADVVQQVLLTSEQDFSCAVQGEVGAALEQYASVKSCRFLLWSGDAGARFHVFVWTADRPATVKVSLSNLAIRSFGGGNLDGGEAGRARIGVSGRYRTGPLARCRPVASGPGVFPSCEDAASFSEGEVLVAVPGGGRVALEEEVASLGASVVERRVVSGEAASQRQRSREQALHLAEVRAPFGASTAPACSLLGGVASLDSFTCFAATGPVKDSSLSTWTSPGARLAVDLARRAAPWPSERQVLAPGTSMLRWDGEAARWSLPAEGFRVKLALPTDAWAVLLDDDARPRDVCAPRRAPSSEAAGALATCVLRGRGGELVLVANARHDARADLLVLSSAEAPRALMGLRETKAAAPGRERISVAPAPDEREVRVEGRGALACAIHLDNGVHVAGCRARLPAGQGADVRVEHDDRPWRVFTHRPGEADAARFGALPLAAAPGVSLGTAVALSGSSVQRRLELKSSTAVRVRATSGVCALATAGRVVMSEGLGGGCDVSRIMPPGSHVIVVRPFGSAPLSGNVHVFTEPVLPLDEGVGAETIVGAGDARIFRFALAADGEVGLGLQARSDVLRCVLLDEQQRVVGDGCHQFHRLARGTYYLRVDGPADGPPLRFKPVVFGLRGAVDTVPEPWLRDFFSRISTQEVSR